MSSSLKICILILGMLFNLNFLTAQFQGSYYYDEPDSIFTAGDLDLYINAAGFFQNYEFFDIPVEGYTLPGYFFQPALKYYFTGKLSASGGVHFLKYHGKEKFNKILPFFSLNYQALPELLIKIGSFKMGGNLRLPEALNKFENHFTRNTGNGVLIKKRGDVWNSTTWLDWMTFIEPGDRFREEFIFGHSGKFRLINKESFSLKLPVYIIINHKGGQINDNKEPVETITDMGTGLEFNFPVNSTIFNSLTFLGNFYAENDYRPKSNGTALRAFSMLEGPLFSLGVGYFNQNNWESVMGENLLFPYTAADDGVNKSGEYLLFKAGFGKKIGRNSSFIVRFDGYFDTNAGRLQYSYGIHLLLNEWISILKGK